MTDASDRLVDLPWIIVGYGRVGQSLALLAQRLGATVAATWNRSAEAAENAVIPSPNPLYGELPQVLRDTLQQPALIWLTVVDDAIADVFSAVEPHISDDSIVVHTSGSLSTDILADHSGFAVASLHPLQAISDPTTAVERFSRCTWTIEGDDDAVGYLMQLLAGANIKPLRIAPEHKVLYHASAVTAANLLVSLFDAAIAMAEAADIDSSTARKMLVELGLSSLENLAEKSPSEALTGPASRGDMTTIENHRRALIGLDDPALLQIYNLLTARALDRLAKD